VQTSQPTYIFLGYLAGDPFFMRLASAFRAGLNDAGYIEGQTLRRFDRYWPNADNPCYPPDVRFREQSGRCLRKSGHRKMPASDQSGHWRNAAICL
jgi:hypothetical protein